MKLFKVTAVIDRKTVSTTVRAEDSQKAREVAIGSINAILKTALQWDEIVKIREC